MEDVAISIIRGWFSTDTPEWLYIMPLWPVAVVGLWGLWYIARMGRDEKKIERSLNWPETQGRVTSSKVGWAHVETVYEYWVNAEKYEATDKITLTPVAVGGRSTSAARSAQALASEAKNYMKDFPVGTKVIVRYNGSNPRDSVLYCAGEVKPAEKDEPKIEAHFVTLE